ncbi:thiamine-monophosphate kinase [Thiosulfatimonas sediminis]|uniref:Thiamine-monophosphate kinase n=1 Tax=Thiosulfatimonas sediminis TaxID=2675054 RepID=A0A6F8PUA7_9GAMM|nr:thiamine-phosphate kinase [Thiosulfatimonas sediminis]BBP45705.1 thiamine-monophosphate kinase [Thiosulfatimonas sediminis]
MEFDLINCYFAPLGLSQSSEQAALDGTDIGIGDDGAVLSVPAGKQLVVVTDTLVSGVHFPENTCAYDVAWKALAVNLSDLAAMAATPFAYSLGLSLPTECATNQDWMADFALGFADLVASTGLSIALIGGDTTRSKVLTLTVSAKGWVDYGQAILRSGAQEGDYIVVSGVLGEGALGLQVALHQIPMGLSAQQKQAALDYLNRPQPQLLLGELLSGVAHSAIDISDGLLQDLGHILKSSNKKQRLLGETKVLGAHIELDRLPLSAGMQALFAENENWAWPLSGGDDYQLCFTISAEALAPLLAVAQQNTIPLSVIGQINDRGKIEASLRGQPFALDAMLAGFQHF